MPTQPEEMLAKLTSRVQSLVCPHITPVLGVRGGVPYSIGTATLLQHDNRTFVVTAAHVAAKISDGYRLGIFAGQGEPPTILFDDWWGPVGEPMGPCNWREDVVILDITNLEIQAKSPLNKAALVEPIELSEKQGIFLSGYAKNPKDVSNGSDSSILQSHDDQNKRLCVRALTSSAPFLPNVPDLRSFEFPVYFSATENKALDGSDLGYVFSAKGFSGSAVWRVKNSPPSPRSVSTEGLEMIGVATRWCEMTSTVLVTRSSVILEVLEKCLAGG